jgi:hypothetical protein
VLESSIQPWTGKPLLGPTERAAKKVHLQRVEDMRCAARKMVSAADELALQSDELDRNGQTLLPHISLCMSLYGNFRAKVFAARHKESLLERMTLDEIKNGLFGSNMKEQLLNKDQMQAIHASLRDRKIELKDTTSLQRLVDETLAEEEKLLQRDLLRKALLSGSKKSTSRRLLDSHPLSLSAHSSMASLSSTSRTAATHSKSSFDSLPGLPTVKKGASSSSATPASFSPTSKQPQQKKKMKSASTSRLSHSHSARSPIKFSDDDSVRAKSREREPSRKSLANDLLATKRPTELVLPPIGKNKSSSVRVSVPVVEDDVSIGQLSLSSDKVSVSSHSNQHLVKNNRKK